MKNFNCNISRRKMFFNLLLKSYTLPLISKTIYKLINNAYYTTNKYA